MSGNNSQMSGNTGYVDSNMSGDKFQMDGNKRYKAGPWAPCSNRNSPEFHLHIRYQKC